MPGRSKTQEMVKGDLESQLCQNARQVLKSVCISYPSIFIILQIGYEFRISTTAAKIPRPT